MKKETYFWVLLGTAIICFSSWLMIHTFSYDKQTSSLLIATKAWSDFGAHIPLIRSFSLGNNWPVEYPLFPGEPIRYHFLFYFLVGMLEKIGLRIDSALNSLSILGFAGLMMGIAMMAQALFKNKRITLLSLLFFLCNGSFSFLRFFTQHPLSLHSISDIARNTVFPSFAPWGGGDISAFWNLNIYTNQRHLGAAFALALLFIDLLLSIEKKPFKKQLLVGMVEIAILAALPFFHQPILLILAVFMLCYFFLFPNLRKILLFIGGISTLCIIPQLLPLLHGLQTFHFEPGYLAGPHASFFVFSWYWIQNLGLHAVLIPLGWLLAPKKVKKITVPLFFLFLLPNLFQFSVEMAANHKFFNFYLLVGTMLSAYALIRLWQQKWKWKVLTVCCRILVGVAIFFCVLSGIIDFFPIANDGYVKLEDIQGNPVATWIRDHTPPDAVILNSSYFFHPASLAGRKIFYGWPYFAWSAGYNTTKRDQDIKTLYETTDTALFCRLIALHHISYITYQKTQDIEHVTINKNVLEAHADPVFTNGSVVIFTPRCP